MLKKAGKDLSSTIADSNTAWGEDIYNFSVQYLKALKNVS